MLHPIITVLLVGVLAAGEPAASVVWWEAEACQETNWPGGTSGKGAFSPADDASRRMLSGSVWLNAMGFKGVEDHPFVQYEVEVPAEADYAFWARMFGMSGGGVRGPVRIRFDDGAWAEHARGTGTTLHAVKPQSNSTLAWIRLQKVHLAAGRHRVRMEILDHADAAGLDCFVLARGAFHPNGTLKPGERLGLAMDGWWPFEPDPDAFDTGAVLDLSGLNHRPAGSRGWIGRSADGNALALEGKPIRLWSVELGTRNLEIEDLDEHARFLSKRGVNAVRFFESIEPKDAASSVADIDLAVRERAWRVVAAMRQQGIYVMITPFWTYNAMIQRSWALPHHPAPPGIGRRKPDGAFIVEPALREAYKGWMRAFLTTPNPYTGIPLAQDPAVWCVQIHNEQSPLFYTYMYGCEPGALRALGKRFGDWLIQRHGSLEATWTAWGLKPGEVSEKGNAQFPADDLENGIVGIPPHLHGLSLGYLRSRKGKETSSYDLRNRDYLQFLAGEMRDAYADLSGFIRRDLGYRGLISACNWKSRDPVTLDDVERWTYTPGDVMDRHHYIGGPHLNPTSGGKVGYQINAGDLYDPISSLTGPRPALPTNFKAVEGYPSIVSESTWTPPARYQSEGPLLIACYGALTGLDMFNWFQFGAVGWDMPMGKWDSGTPMIQGQFPATALIYRLGYVREAAPVVIDRRTTDDLWRLRFPLLAEDLTYDPNVDRTFVAGMGDAGGTVSPLAFLTGPVRTAFVDQPAKASITDLQSCIDPQRQTVSSVTGELRMDMAQGVFSVDAAKAQGACGFLGKAGRIALADITLESANAYASVVVVPLDDRPIAASRRLLVQMGTIARPYGWSEQAEQFNVNLNDKKAKPEMVDGQRILALGGPPWNVERLDARLSVRNPALRTAQPLDANGVAAGPAIPVEPVDGGLSLRLPADVLYLVLQ